MKISEIKELLQGNPEPSQLAELAQDKRVGTQKLLESYYARKAKETKEIMRFEKMMEFEHKLYEQGVRYVAGVDEAGRGPLAGPLVVAAVILPRNVFISGLNDSKQLSAKKRDQLYDEIMAKALDIRVNIVSVYNIDRLNIYQATKQAMEQILASMSLKPQAALTDAMPVDVEDMQITPLVHGDALSASIAAASIIAKVTRDRIMQTLDVIYPEYGYASNKGYGSAAHMQAVREKGATKWHRRSYEPVKSMGLEPVAPEENLLYSPLTDSLDYKIS